MPEPRAPGIYVDEVSNRNMSIAAAPTSVTAFVGGAELGPTGVPVTVRSLDEFSASFGASPGPLATAVELFFLNGGKEAVVLQVAKRAAAPSARVIGKEALVSKREQLTRDGIMTGRSPALANSAPQLDASCFTADKGGIRALDGAAFNLLYILPYRAGESVDIEVLAAAAAYCRERRAMLIIDAPREWADVSAAERGAASLRSALGADAKNAILYFPYLRRGSGAQEVPPGAAVAGIIARTDAQRGVWRSPAGLEAQVRGADGAVVPISDADIDRLNPAGVNSIRTLPGAGLAVWGARTLAGSEGGDPEWNYIPVRRLALLIEESLIRGLSWTAFEPNGEALWALVRQAASSLLDDLYRKGAFQGGSPRDAYFVKCDRETTASADIDRSITNLVVGFAPLGPAEFVILRVQLRTATRP